MRNGIYHGLCCRRLVDVVNKRLSDYALGSQIYPSVKDGFFESKDRVRDLTLNIQHFNTIVAANATVYLKVFLT